VKAFLRSMFRRLNGPRGRRCIVLALVAGLWAWWLWAPPKPLVRWTIPASCIDSCALTVDSSTLVVTPRSGMPGLFTSGLPFFSPDDLFQAWDLATGERRLSVPRVPARELNVDVLHVAPDGSWLIVHNGGRTSVIDGHTGAELAACDGFRQFAIAPDSRTLVVVDGEGRVVLWNAATRRGTPLFTRRAETPLMFSGDGRRFAAFDGPDFDEYAERQPNGLRAAGLRRLDGRSRVRVWDVTTGQERAALPVPASGSSPAIALDADGRRLALYYPPHRDTPDGVVQIWTVGAAIETVAVLSEPGGLPDLTNSGSVKSLEFSPDGRVLALRVGGGRNHIWDLSPCPPRSLDELLIQRPGPARINPYNSIFTTSRYPIFSPHGRWMVVPAPEAGRLEVRPTADASHRSVVRLPELDDEATLVFSPDGTFLATAVEVRDFGTAPEQWLNDRVGVPVLPRNRLKIQLFEAETGSERAAWTVSGYFGGRLLGFAADGRRVWTETHATDPANSDGERAIELWDETIGRAPAWLLATTVAGLLFVVTDWRRNQSQRDRKLQST